jgi:hypothetical protein
MVSGSESLAYTVEAWSAYASHYHPRNILEESLESESRWCSGGASQKQFVLLKLAKPAILREFYWSLLFFDGVLAPYMIGRCH